MTATRSAFDALMAFLAVLAWGFAIFIFGARWFSPAAGGLAALAVVLSASAMVLSMHLRDRTLLSLTRGACPRCRAPIVPEHRHRRWDPDRSAWDAPSVAWECDACGFAHAEAWPCPGCPGT